MSCFGYESCFGFGYLSCFGFLACVSGFGCVSCFGFGYLSCFGFLACVSDSRYEHGRRKTRQIRLLSLFIGFTVFL